MSNQQVPSQVPLIDSNGTVNSAWLAFFTNLNGNGNGNGNSGNGNGSYVADGTSSSYAPATFAQGPDAFKGTATTGSVYLAVDTLKLYVSQSGTWKQLLPGYTGDVTSTAGGTVLSLATVNTSPGTYGNSTNVAVPTVDAKGRVTSITQVPIAFPIPTNTADGLVSDLEAGTLNIPSRKQHVTVTQCEISGLVTVFGTLAVI